MSQKFSIVHDGLDERAATGLVPPGHPPAWGDDVLSAPPERALVGAVPAEEDGRVHHAENRCLPVEAQEDLPTEVRPDYNSMTTGQLLGCVLYGTHVNVSARSLLTCVAR